MLLADLWYIHRERILLAAGIVGVAAALFLFFVVIGKGDKSAAQSAQTACVPGADPVAALASGEFRQLSPQQAAKVNPRLKELNEPWPVVYWWRTADGWPGVYVSVFRGARHGFYGDQVHDITSAAYGPGTVIEPTHITGYKGYEQWVPRRTGHTVAFETRCDQVGFFAPTKEQAKAAAESLLPLIDPPTGQPKPLSSTRS